MNQATKWFTSVRQANLTTQLNVSKSLGGVRGLRVFDSRAHSLTANAQIGDEEQYKLPNGFITMLPEEDVLHPPPDFQPGFVFELLSTTDVNAQKELTPALFKKMQGHLKENVKKVYLLNPFKKEWSVLVPSTRFETLEWRQSACLSPEEMPWIKLDLQNIFDAEDFQLDDYTNFYRKHENE